MTLISSIRSINSQLIEKNKSYNFRLLKIANTIYIRETDISRHQQALSIPINKMKTI